MLMVKNVQAFAYLFYCENSTDRLLVHLYKACIEAVQRVIDVYSNSLDADLVKHFLCIVFEIIAYLMELL